MGWFLKSNKTKTKKKTKHGKSVDPKWDPQRTLLGVKFATAAGAIVAVALAWQFGAQRLQGYINDNHAQEVSAQDIRFSEKPTLMAPAEINLLRGQLATAVGSSPLNREGLKKAADLLRERPDIVKELRQVRRMPDGTVAIDLSFRTPAAIVQMRNERTGILSTDGYHVIDDKGYQMYGPKDMDEINHLKLPLIRGVNSKYRPKDNHGEHRWQGQEVDAALALITQMQGTPAIDCIDSISVNVRDERDRIRLVINTVVVPSVNSKHTDCRIVWGLPPGQERSIEPDADRKLDALTALLAHGQYQMGLWNEVWINNGKIRPNQAIRSAAGNR